MPVLAVLHVLDARLIVPDAAVCSVPPKLKPCPPCSTNRSSSGAARVASGEPMLERNDIPGVVGMGLPWGQTTSFQGQLSVDYNLGLGSDWQAGEWSHLGLQFYEGTYNLGANEVRVFRQASGTTVFRRENGGDYTGSLNTRDQLSYNSTTKRYRFTQPDGSVIEYLGLNGMFKRHTDANGNFIEVPTGEWADNGFNFRTVRRVTSAPQGSIVEDFDYTYDNQGSHDPHLTNLLLTRIIGGDLAIPVSRASYTYYEAGDPHGSAGDARTVETQITGDAETLTSMGTTYYRYHFGTGPLRLPKYVLGPAAFARLQADPSVTDPFTASDAIVALYADHYFEYDGNRRVTRDVERGGSLETQFTYASSSFWGDYNYWTTKTTETLPDGSQNVYYSNYAGQTMLKVFQSDGEQWCEFTRYDTTGRPIWQANPSAVSGYDEAYADLLHQVDGHYEYLRDHDGLIHVVAYDETSNEVVAEKVRQGELGSDVLQRSRTYIGHSGGMGVGTTFFIETDTAYPVAGGSGDTTSYSDTFYSGTNGIQQRVTTLPVVSTSQNGSGTAATRTDVFDPYGNLTWTKDERGFITRRRYDIGTAAMIQQVDDVDTSLYSDVPTGWTTPSGGGLNLITDSVNDPQGRITQTLGPVFRSAGVPPASSSTDVRTASWTVFNDGAHITYAGQGDYDLPDATFTLTNPVSITKMETGGRVNEQIQATAPSTAGTLAEIIDNAGGGAAAFPQSSYSRWSTFQYTDCCLAASQRAYHQIPSTGSGSSGTNYDQTNYGYDVLKRNNRTVTPGGEITFLVFDPRGNIASAWIGTNDDGATETDPTGGGASGNNMQRISANEYDGGADGGDGNLTLTTESVDATTTHVTAMLYDWRNRRVVTDGELNFYEVTEYDNLDRVTRTERYDSAGSGGSSSSSSSSSSASSSSSSGGGGSGILILRSDSRYDSLGRTYQTIRYAVDPATGTVGNALTSNM